MNNYEKNSFFTVNSF